MDIRKYLETQKQQSNISSGVESGTEESLCRADKSKTFMSAPASYKLSEEEMLQEKA